jgi:YHS domain-containing protein
MEGLLSLLLFTALFFLMMRFGCSAHMMHGGHGGRSGGATVSTDPVCGMPVPIDRSYRKVHQGQNYRFCSRACLDKFDREPDRYISQTDMKETP